MCVNNSQWTWECKYLFEIRILILLDNYPEVGLYYMAVLFLFHFIFLGTWNDYLLNYEETHAFHIFALFPLIFLHSSNHVHFIPSSE